MSAMIISAGGGGKETITLVTRDVTRREGLTDAGLIPLVGDGPVYEGYAQIPDGTPPEGWDLGLEPGDPGYVQFTADQRGTIERAKDGARTEIPWLVQSDAKTLPTGDDAAPEAGFGGIRVSAAISADLAERDLERELMPAVAALEEATPAGRLPLVVLVYSTAGGTGCGYGPRLGRVIRRAIDGDVRIVEVIITPLAFRKLAEDGLVAASTVAALREVVRDGHSGRGGGITIPVGVPPEALRTANAREGTLATVSGFIAFLARDHQFAEPEFVDWTARLANRPADAAFVVPGYAEAGLPVEQYARIFSAHVAAEVYEMLVPDHVDAETLARTTEGMLSGDGLLGQLAPISAVGPTHDLPNFIYDGPSHREIIESLDPARQVELPTLPDLAQMFTPGLLARTNPEEIISAATAEVIRYLGAADRTGATGTAFDSLDGILDDLGARIVAHVNSHIFDRCVALLDSDDAPRPLSVQPSVGVLLQRALKNAAGVGDAAADRLEIERDKLSGQPLQNAREAREDAAADLRNAPSRKRATVYLQAAQDEMELSAWVATMETAVTAARKQAGVYRRIAAEFDTWLTTLRSARDYAREEERVATRQLEYDASRPVTTVLPTEEVARQQLRARHTEGQARAMLEHIALRPGRREDGRFELHIRHDEIQDFMPVVQAIDSDDPLFSPVLAMAGVRERIVPGLRRLSLVDALCLDLRAWLADRGGNATNELIDEFLTDRLAELERNAVPVSETTRGDGVFAHTWGRLLYDGRPPTDRSGDGLPARVAERLRAAVGRQYSHVGAVPDVYGAGIVRVNVGVGVALSHLEGFTPLVARYFAHHSAESRQDPSFRAVHANLGDRTAHMIEQFLHTEAGRLDGGRLLAPSVVDLLEDVEAVRLVARLYATANLPVAVPDDPNDPARVVIEVEVASGRRSFDLGEDWNLGAVCAEAVSGPNAAIVKRELKARWEDYVEKLRGTEGNDVRPVIHEQLRTAADTLTLPPVPAGQAGTVDRGDLELVFWTLLKATDRQLGIEHPPA
ncbi:MAG: hypothetical protein IT198_17260 [Acidimicrobiia bacterium]|nr:hypothetical protein [Acidimicrobiia bacterium]